MEPTCRHCKAELNHRHDLFDSLCGDCHKGSETWYKISKVFQDYFDRKYKECRTVDDKIKLMRKFGKRLEITFGPNPNYVPPPPFDPSPWDKKGVE